MNTLQIYRNELPHLLIPIDENTFFSHVVMGEHIISSSFIIDEPLDVDEGDYVLFRGDRFTINKPLPPFDKTNSFTYKYDLVFEGYIYDLLDKVFTHLGAMEFSYFGTPLAFIQLIVENMNSISSGWSVGDVDVLEEMLIEFFQDGQGFTCKGALTKIAQAFTLEFWLTGKTINLTAQAGVVTKIDFEYGRGKGLYKISRGEIADQQYYNRLIGQGGIKNIPSNYRNGAKRLSLPEVYLELPLVSGKRRKEGSVLFNDIFPKRTGTLTAVSANWLSLTDTSLDFDLNGRKIDGVAQQVSFVSGENSGRDFNILGYNHATKTITIEPLTDTDGYVSPNATFEIKAGDKYILFGISLPDSYVTNAESDLRTEMAKLLDKVKNNKPPYAVEIDEKHMRDNGYRINAGDRARLKDSKMAINDLIRVSSVKFPLVNEDKVTIVLSDTLSYLNEEIQIKENDAIKKNITIVDRRNAEKARNNSLNMRKLQGRIFNPDGSLFEGENSVVAGMGAFGYDSQNFGLIGVTISTNPGASENSLNISQGKLVHYIYKIDGLGYQWAMDASEWAGLDPLKYYYVYAKCSKTSLSGQWIISETPVFVNDIVGYYAFNVGQLFEVNADGYRDFEFTKGMTYIVGDTITSGRIQDITKQNYLDLNTGKFNLGDLLSGLDWSVTTEGKLTVRGEIIATNAQFINLLVRNLETQAEGKKVVINGDKNCILFDDESSKTVIYMDTSAAVQDGTFESTSDLTDFNGNPQWISSRPVYYPGAPGEVWYFIYTYLAYDAGIQVGYGLNDAAGCSFIGRKKIMTTGRVQASNPDGTQHATLTKTGLVTTGDILAATGFKTKDSSGATKTGDTGRIVGARPTPLGVTATYIDVVNGLIVGWGDGT
jgi:hypothetical protein